MNFSKRIDLIIAQYSTVGTVFGDDRTVNMNSCNYNDAYEY